MFVRVTKRHQFFVLTSLRHCNS